MCCSVWRHEDRVQEVKWVGHTQAAGSSLGPVLSLTTEDGLPRVTAHRGYDTVSPGGSWAGMRCSHRVLPLPRPLRGADGLSS